ncbi:MAG: cytochrome oxidase assembly protein [Herminiimonas sp.]|nr:cytochrome oxidase assembly protein [Herminiimonas sp.]MDB5853098.1 cytochrome oxidase assembly protein [Herminiimonas sp.]
MGPFTMRLLTCVLLLGMAGVASGHATSADRSIYEWTFEPWVVVCLMLSMGLYIAGVARLAARVRQGRALLKKQAACFAAGWCALAVSLVSPLDELGSHLFSAHMVQHEMLMIVAAPLLVLGRPLAVWTWAIRPDLRVAVGSITRHPLVHAPWRIMTEPISAWLLHAAALWLWHVPALFQAALANEAVHAAQHASFLATALLFWWAVLGQSARSVSNGASVVYLFTTMMHTAALGALLTMSDKLWYPVYAAGNGAFGLSPIEDQQLGGLIMWVPGGLPYLIAGLVLCSRWLVDERQPMHASTTPGAGG